MKPIIILLSSLAFLSGCPSSPLPKETFADKMQGVFIQCGAGVSNRLSANVKATISKNLEDGVDAEAGVEQEIETAIFKDNQALDPNNLPSVYEKYIGCLETMSK